MKIFFSIVFAFVSSIATAQKTEAYYDYNWKPCELSDACFLSETEQKDTVWKRTDYYIRESKLQMAGFYKDKGCKIKHGFFTYYHANGFLSSLGLFVNDKKQGLWLSFHSNGMMEDSTVYQNDKPVGISLGWFPNGNIADSNEYNVDGTSVKVSWFDNGQLSSAGRELNEKPNGKWIFYDRKGNKTADEIYDTGKITSRIYYNEDGTTLTDTTNRDREATCKIWKKYLEQQLSFPYNIKIANNDKAIVVVNFTVDEEGKITDAFVSSPFHPSFDTIALEIVRKGPNFLPAIDHNRSVKRSLQQPITFQ